MPHPSIIQVRDFGEEDDTLYTVTELIEGPSLAEVLDAEAPFEWPRTRVLGGQLIGASAAMHRRSTLICGVNPAIIRMTTDEEGERLMMSTGGVSEMKELLASLSDEEVRGGELSDRQLPYIAPEVLTGRHADVAADIFAIGALLYQMATGIQPFAGRTLPELLGAMMAGKPREPRELSPGMPQSAAACMLRCLERDPQARFLSAAELRDTWLAPHA